MLAPLGNLLIRHLLAPCCAACNRDLAAPLEGALCQDCVAGVIAITPPICVRCGDHVPRFDTNVLCARCQREPPVIVRARSAGVYDGALRDMIHALKYQKRRMIAPWLAARMRDSGRSVLDGADAVIPVPLHPWRYLQRGFNQASDLAERLHCPVWHALWRHRGGPPQAGLPAARRQNNARNAYAVVPGAHLRYPRLRGAVVVLVDDVMTTGATLNACALALHGAGVASVRALTAARAVATRPPTRPPTPHLSIVHRR